MAWGPVARRVWLQPQALFLASRAQGGLPRPGGGCPWGVGGLVFLASAPLLQPAHPWAPWGRVGGGPCHEIWAWSGSGGRHLGQVMVPAQWSQRPAQGLPAWQQRTHGAKRRAWGVRAESSGWGWAVGQWVPSARAGRGPGQGCPPPCACWCRVWPSPARSPVRWAVSQWGRPPSARPQPARH